MGIVPLQNPQNDADGEPTATDLDAIEAEWPVIAAELDLLDAEIALLTAEGRASVLDHRRIRRAEHRVLAAGRMDASDLRAAQDVDGAA